MLDATCVAHGNSKNGLLLLVMYPLILCFLLAIVLVVKCMQGWRHQAGWSGFDLTNLQAKNYEYLLASCSYMIVHSNTVRLATTYHLINL